MREILEQKRLQHGLLAEVEKRGIVADQADINRAILEITGAPSIDVAERQINNV